ncbi:MAG: ptpA 2, partial [Prosthecobacter sp.]|nr:ptpA 2 [Prosthecobacter sp.]
MKSILLLLLSTSAMAADFDHALSLPKRTENLVSRDRVKANWLPDGQSFWYRIQTAPKQHEFVLINATTGTRKTAASLKALGLPEAEALKSSTAKIELRKTSRTGEESGLKFINQLDADVDLFWINQQGEHESYGRIRAGSEREQHTFEGHVWLITSLTGEYLAVIEAGPTPQTLVIDGKGISKANPDAPKPDRGVKSPDGKWSVMIEQDFVLLRNIAADKTARLKIELAAQSPLHGKPVWSPDSSTFVISSSETVPVRKVGFIESTPKVQFQPGLQEFNYAKPGDALPKPFPLIFHINDNGCEWTPVKSDLFPNPFITHGYFDYRWSADSTEFYFDYNQRGHQLYQILAVNARTGDVRVVVEETSKTFIDY